MSGSLDRFECNAPAVIFEHFEDETILINLDSGNYYSLDTVGAAVWELMQHGLSVANIVRRIQQAYESDAELIERAIRELLERLLQEELVRPVLNGRVPEAGAGNADAPAGIPEAIPETSLPALGGSFTPPSLARYDDMAEMLLLDPVHDVDERGWPSAAAPPREIQIEDEDAESWPGMEAPK